MFALQSSESQPEMAQCQLLWYELSTIGNNARLDMRLGVYNTEKKNINDKATIMLDTIDEHSDVNQVCLCTTIHTTHRVTNIQTKDKEDKPPQYHKLTRLRCCSACVLRRRGGRVLALHLNTADL